MSCGKNENKQKEAGIGPFFKKKNQVLIRAVDDDDTFEKYLNPNLSVIAVFRRIL